MTCDIASLPTLIETRGSYLEWFFVFDGEDISTDAFAIIESAPESLAANVELTITGTDRLRFYLSAANAAVLPRHSTFRLQRTFVSGEPKSLPLMGISLS